MKTFSGATDAINHYIKPLIEDATGWKPEEFDLQGIYDEIFTVAENSTPVNYKVECLLELNEFLEVIDRYRISAVSTERAIELVASETGLTEDQIWAKPDLVDVVNSLCDEGEAEVPAQYALSGRPERVLA